jgi:serine-type D-Ala-D-Ala carboxypeptidase (penicillin-binding protein 5/6)
MAAEGEALLREVPLYSAQEEVARARRAALSASRERAAVVREARRRGLRRLAGIGMAGVVAIVLLLSVANSTGSDDTRPSSFSGHSASVPVVGPVLRSTLAASMRFPGKPVALPLPKRGEGAVAVAGVGLVGSTKNERSVPIASVTKIMTAYLVLKDHPLVGRSNGPVFVMTGKDHQAWIQASEDGDSNIEILTGERLNERQLLQALMIPSADNIADYLASWDAGSVPAFVAKMNAEAVSLGLSGTHYADASGVNPGSRSTAVDMATLASLAMENPELRSIVDEQSIRLPVAGEIWNVYNPAIGVDGIIGVKSGFTEAAQANLVTAAWRVVAGHRELVVSAAIDQPLSLWGVAQEDEALLGAATRELSTMTLVAGRAEVGQAVAAWNHSRSLVRVGAPAVVVGWPGLALSPAVVAAKPSVLTSKHGWQAGATVGTFVVLSPFGIELTEPVLLQSPIGPPPAGWKQPGLVR